MCNLIRKYKNCLLLHLRNRLKKVHILFEMRNASVLILLIFKKAVNIIRLLSQLTVLFYILPGLDALHTLTSTHSYELRVDLEDWDGNWYYATYSNFTIAGRDDNYRLGFTRFTGGNAGNSLHLCILKIMK